MGYGFHELVAHACRTRDLVAGTVIGSGTVSNENFRDCGSSCIAERRGIEIVDQGAPKTEFMKFGDTVRMQGTLADGRAPVGAVEARAGNRVGGRALRSVEGCGEGVQFARAEGILPAPEANHAVRGAIDEALQCKEE